MAPSHFTSYTVSYESENHWAVLTQLWGSKWPQVLPYCLFNVGLMLVLTILDKHIFKGEIHILEISKQGHAFITFVVAFLLISRVTTALSRYGAARDHLGVMYQEGRELVQNCCVFSGDCKQAVDQEWRHELTYRSMILLRSVMAVIDYPTDRVLAWEVPELNGKERADVLNVKYSNPSIRRFAHGQPYQDWEEAMRVPVRLEYLLNKTIHSQSKRLSAPLPSIFENRLLGSVGSFMNAFYGMKTFMTTMARTFLFLYVFTIPFVLLGANSTILAHCFMVFLMTYGFVGLELVAIELDNPFGNDANDFDNMSMALTAFEDTYLTILDVDGPQWTDKLRARMHNPSQVATSPEQLWLNEAVKEYSPGVAI